ncbi:MAG: homoserine O-acetyltransferase, partial [Chloroflexi bacterium]|nr:homoserine O-acetyltransferase [Chloroflexota bacterium]
MAEIGDIASTQPLVTQDEGEAPFAVGAALGSIGLVETHYLEVPGRLTLEAGRSLDDITVAYETYGELNARRDNGILLCHALSGDAHAAGYLSDQDTRPGWWDTMVGPGKAFDTTKYFVICSNVLGGCRGTTGPMSINPATGRVYGGDFPVVTVGDMVRVQALLLDALGI